MIQNDRGLFGIDAVLAHIMDLREVSGLCFQNLISSRKGILSTRQWGPFYCFGGYQILLLPLTIHPMLSDITVMYHICVTCIYLNCCTCVAGTMWFIFLGVLWIKLFATENLLAFVLWVEHDNNHKQKNSHNNCLPLYYQNWLQICHLLWL